MNCIKPAFSDFNSIEFSKSCKAKFSTYCVPKGLHRKRQQRTEPCSHCCSSIVSCIIACLLVWPPLSYKLKSYCLENFQLRAKWKGIRRSTPFGGTEEKRSHFWKVILLRAFFLLKKYSNVHSSSHHLHLRRLLSVYLVLQVWKSLKQLLAQDVY